MCLCALEWSERLSIGAGTHHDALMASMMITRVTLLGSKWGISVRVLRVAAKGACPTRSRPSCVA